ncbi:uncharacterized protein TNCV_1623201 [Trichonephila clavipes]|nr:uncharacterized protein TNCV_1623201 [Trichonephila clavipes]
MTFLCLEVQGEEMVQLAKSGFGTPIGKKDSPTERVKPTKLMTASALASSEKSSDQERKVRVLIDTACENSYISESVTSILKATPLREEAIIHSLFGGNDTKPKHYSVFSIEVSDMKHSYACCFEVLSEKKICGFISKIEDKRILNELKNKEIILSDLNCKETEIGLLIGADNIGKLLTGNLIEFDSGLTAIETKLGWTVIEKKKYLSELIQKQNDNRVREPRIGEMVLIGNDNKKRLHWPIAKIIELIPGRDGEIRTVRLKTHHGTVIRPVQRTFPLEVQAIANSDKELKEESISVKSIKPEKVLNTNDAIVKKIYFFWNIG